MADLALVVPFTEAVTLPTACLHGYTGHIRHTLAPGTHAHEGHYQSLGKKSY